MLWTWPAVENGSCAGLVGCRAQNAVFCFVPTRRQATLDDGHKRQLYLDGLAVSCQ